MNGKKAKAIRHDAELLKIPRQGPWASGFMTLKEKIKFMKKMDKGSKLIRKPKK